MAEKKKETFKTIATNRKARRDYAISETLEGGLALRGTEVKSLRFGKANIEDSFAVMENGEVFLRNMHISPYEFGNRANVDPKRKRKLLLRRAEINRLAGKVAQRGFTLIPLSIYFKRGLAKVEIALAKAKKMFDKREGLKKEIMQREVRRELKGRP